MVYKVCRGRESLSGSLSVSSLEQVVGMVFLGWRGGEMGVGGYVFYLVLRIGEHGVSCRIWVEVGTGRGGHERRRAGSVARVVLIFFVGDGVLCDLIRVLLRCGWLLCCSTGLVWDLVWGMISFALI